MPLVVLLVGLVLPALGDGAALPASGASVPPVTPVAPAPPPADTLPILRLGDAVGLALKNQPTLHQSRAAAAALDARVTEARASLLPQVTASASYQRVHGSASSRGSATTFTGNGATVGGTPAGGAAGIGGTAAASMGTIGSAGLVANGTYNFFSAGASASQLLWDFGQAYHRLRASELAADAGLFSTKGAELLTILAVRRAYFLARAYKALERVASDAFLNTQRHLLQAEGYVRAGTRPEIDLVQSKADLASARVQVITAENNYALAKTQLMQAIGSGGTIAFDVGDETIPPVDAEDLPVEALDALAANERPELRSFATQEQAQRLAVKGAKAGYGPALSAVGGFSEVGTALSDLGPSWNIGATLAWPFFQGGLTHGVVREAEANLDLAQAQLEGERLQVRTEVEQAALTLRAQKATVEAAGDAEMNAKERLRLAEARYLAGVGNILELGDAQVALTTASAQRIQAELGVATARAQLLAALGRR